MCSNERLNIIPMDSHEIQHSWQVDVFELDSKRRWVSLRSNATRSGSQSSERNASLNRYTQQILNLKIMSRASIGPMGRHLRRWLSSGGRRVDVIKNRKTPSSIHPSFIQSGQKLTVSMRLWFISIWRATLSVCARAHTPKTRSVFH